MWPFSRSYPTKTPEDVASKKFDYIIVGGGTAGCVLASRLSENPDVSVLVLERGAVIDTWFSRVPLLSIDYRPSTAPRFSWRALPGLVKPPPGSVPQYMVTGKALGGTSKINAFVYARSVPAEYNAWAEAGREGWSWKDVEPYFVGLENTLSYKSPHRGTKGRWKLRRVDTEYFKSTAAVMGAASSFGIPFVPEANDPASPPISSFRGDFALDERSQRQSTHDAFLPCEIAKQRRRNLFVCPGVVASKIDLQPTENGLKAVGVYFQGEGKKGQKGSPTQFYVSARHEIIICSGAIATPQILLLSGVGPTEHLTSHNIPAVKDLPGVGSHLQDHVGIPLIYNVPIEESLQKLERKPWFTFIELLKYVLLGIGFFLFPNPQLFIFAQSKYLDKNSKTVLPDSSATDGHNPSNIPDIEIMHIPFTAWEFRKLTKDEAPMSFFCVLLRPDSKGTVRLASVDPCERPNCDLGFLTDKRDYEPLRKVTRLGLALGRKVREGGYTMGELLLPKGETDEEIDAFIQTSARTTFHYSSTCRMAPEAEGGVVDDRLRVYGVEGLRIADASIFPTIPATHLQAPAAMVAARCADFLLEARASN